MYSNELDMRYQRAWTRELVREHQAICWRYRVDLPTPIIEISRATTVWGAWDPDARTVRLSASLILEHSWDATLNVLKHEMAHQIVTDIFGAVEGHGPLFAQACDMIGVPEAFRRATGDAPRRLTDLRDEEPIDSNNVRMLEKVRKLLSLARSANENEAFLAMQKANELIEKHNIERIEQQRSARFTYAIIHHKKKRVEMHQRRICLILQDHFFVDVVYAQLFDPIACETYKTIELLGTVENVRIAEYVYHFLMNQTEVLWKAYERTRKGRTVGNKRSYRLGVLKGFHDTLNRQARERTLDRGFGPHGPTVAGALICAEDKGLTTFLKARFPRLRAFRRRGATLDGGSFQAGRKDGERLTLHKGVGQCDGYRGRLLTGMGEMGA